ncbi:MAG: glycosyltransferase family 39 protein [Eudoraea sp.]|nr:glycosyltransferase family 39 protein [Eudoraea sp.]
MLHKVITSLTPNYNKLRGSAVFLLLFTLALFIRLPFFFRDYIDRDESTFILIGQSWVDGFLPYTQLWDVKPPLTFLFFAGIIYIFGKSFLAIRLAGTLLVAITAFYTYKSGALLSTKKNGVIAAFIGVLLLSMFGSIQGVMSEHICMAFFMPALYLLFKTKNPLDYLGAGLLMGMCLMSKLNLAYAILFVGLFLFYDLVKSGSYYKSIWYTALFGMGILLITGLTFLPYYLDNLSELWWESVFIAPLNYAGARRYSPWALSSMLLLIFPFFIWAWKKEYLNIKDRNTILIFVTVVGVILSFIRGGRINSHYLIQLFPVIVIPVVIVFSKIPVFPKFDFRPYVFFLLLALPVETYLEYNNIVRNKIERGTFYNGEGFTVPSYITDHNLETKNILFLGYHIGYWVLGVTPPTKAATHPSNLCKEEMFSAYKNPRKTSMEELRYIMEDLRPKTIVARKGRLIFDEEEVDENNFMDSYLRDYYSVIDTVDNAEIYQRSER